MKNICSEFTIILLLGPLPLMAMLIMILGVGYVRERSMLKSLLLVKVKHYHNFTMLKKTKKKLLVKLGDLFRSFIK